MKFTGVRCFINKYNQVTLSVRYMNTITLTFLQAVCLLMLFHPTLSSSNFFIKQLQGTRFNTMDGRMSIVLLVCVWCSLVLSRHPDGRSISNFSTGLSVYVKDDFIVGSSSHVCQSRPLYKQANKLCMVCTLYIVHGI